MNNPFVVILVNHLWQSTLFVAAIWGLTRLVSRNSARLRYFLWLAASMKFLVPFALLAAMSAQFLWHPASGVSGTVAPQILDLAGGVAAPLAAEFPMYTPQNADARAAWEAVFAVSVIMALVWGAGAVFVAGRWLLRWLEVRRALRKSSTLMGIEFPAPVRATQMQFEPGVVGIFRPRLLLPAGIGDRLTPEQMRAVLAHERCHLHWRDNFTASLHMVVETAFWFFPPVWWIGARLIEEREKDCDEQVVRDGHIPERYAEGILNVCEHYIACRLPCVSGVSGADLRKRIESIIKRTLGVKLDRPRKLALATVLGCTIAAPVVAGMISGNALQMALSPGPATAAMAQYFRVSIASSEESMAGRPLPDISRWSCPDPDPGAATLATQKTLADLVAKMPATHDKALLFAVAANSKKDARQLLAAGAPRKGDDFMHGDTLMHIAAEFADVQMMELLADNGIGIDGRSSANLSADGRTPLITAVSVGRIRNARWLIEHGADASAIDRYKMSPLTLAMSSCRDRNLVTLLLKAGAKADFKALRIADSLGYDLRTDSAMPAPPLQSWRHPAESTASADFDGDGSADLVALHVSADDKSKAVFVKMSSRDSDEWRKVAMSDPVLTPADVALTSMGIAKPDNYVTECGQHNTCEQGKPAQLTLAQPGIDFFLPEGPHRVIYWDKSTGKFTEVVVGK